MLPRTLPQAGKRAVEMEIRRVDETHVPPHRGWLRSCCAPSIQLGAAANRATSEQRRNELVILREVLNR
jgi:hypothetical protein